MGKKPKRVSNGTLQKDPSHTVFDTAKVKKPVSAYILFTQEKRPEVNKRHPDLKSKDIVRFIGKMWNDCGQQERTKYTERAEQQKELYKKHVEEHGLDKAKKEKDTGNGTHEDKRRRTVKPHKAS